ncbi:Putative nuclease [Frankliniella fusca]|uniref:Nuclease n=1 Tax=Frankliniella fusca TaxID=407009 RepID=A0AAE1GYM2_9NEOP|nr:Putative nuclease [Frankliniella fusca]KAK3929420.1 Putative nuclease [Frankliniella fusca]
MLEVDPEVFFEYFRMTPEAFNELLARVAPLIQKRPQYMYIPPGERLALTLHFLATGSYQKFSGALFTIPQPTANGIIRETCEALWDELREEVFPPMTEESMARTMDGFWERWDFPNMIGALDGKHVNMQNQPNAREGEWLNYKGDFSMVLLGMCDANYKFVYVSIGGRGRRHDAGLWKECDLYAALRDGTLPLPPPRQLPGVGSRRVVTPPTIVGDGAFPLGPNLMTPFRQPQIVSDAERIYNYRLSRARRTIENAFGILSSRWRVLRRTFIAHEENARSIIKACVVLHNLLILNQENVPPQRYWYVPARLHDIPGFGEFNLPAVGDNDLPEREPEPAEDVRELEDGREIRQHLVDFFLSPAGEIPYQWRYLTE